MLLCKDTPPDLVSDGQEGWIQTGADVEQDNVTERMES